LHLRFRLVPVPRSDWQLQCKDLRRPLVP
jgi:hypothetical protein